ncbi:MAG: biopolymer transporter ExbD [Prolixibacteraceae bacterium]|nr:biopolymer transporter ExbD [Prolixibacteraceae bacterium]
MARKVPEIPSASLADIAFMLLIFFLVATTMNVDSGLERRLPPWIEEDQDQPEIKERNVFVVLVNFRDELFVQNNVFPLSGIRERAKEFMANPYDLETLPEKEMKEIQFFGEVPVTKGIISLRNDLGTSYGTYIAVQNELVGAINELREELSKSKFGKSYKDLSKEQQDAVREVYPQRISEAEPKQQPTTTTSRR